MSERRTFTLYEPVQAHKALMALWPTIKSMLFAGHRLVLTLAPAKTIYDRMARGWGHKDAVFAPKRR